MTRVYLSFLPPQSPLLKLILSILGCDFCSPTTVSVPVTELWKETSELNRCFEKRKERKKGTTCWRSTAGTEASCHTLSVPHWPSHLAQSEEVTCRAKVMRSYDMPCSISASIGAVGQSSDRWGCINAAISSMPCALLPIFSLQIVHFIYIHCTWSALCTVNAWWNYMKELHY